MCSSSALVCSCVLVGGAFLVASVSGIGFSLFLLFGDPFYGATDGTYDPSFEDIGKLDIYQTDFYLKQNKRNLVLLLTNILIHDKIIQF